MGRGSPFNPAFAAGLDHSRRRFEDIIVKTIAGHHHLHWPDHLGQLDNGTYAKGIKDGSMEAMRIGRTERHSRQQGASGGWVIVDENGHVSLETQTVPRGQG